MTIGETLRHWRTALRSSSNLTPSKPEVTATTWPTGVEKLNLGCGPKVLPGWTNVDAAAGEGVTQHDLTKQFPLPAESVTFVYSEHFIEHITRDEALGLLKECHRLLKPKGVIRLSTPNLSKLVDEYLSGRIDEWSDVDWTPQTSCQLLNEGLRQWGHQFVYDLAELKLLLNEAGFQKINSAAWRESDHPELRELETRPFHGEVILEAVK